MRVKVVKCSDANEWYSSLIGDSFDVVGHYEFYMISKGAHKGGEILRSDCELITDKTEELPTMQEINIDNNRVLKEMISRESIFNDEYFRRQLILALAGNSALLKYTGKKDFPEEVVNMAYEIRKAMK